MLLQNGQYPICFAASPSHYPSTCLKLERLEHRMGGGGGGRGVQQTWLAASSGATLYNHVHVVGVACLIFIITLLV